MHYPIKFDTSVEIYSLRDLPRLKIILEAAGLKPNMSKIARDMLCDRRTAKRYYEGDYPSGKRAKPSSWTFTMTRSRIFWGLTASRFSTANPVFGVI